MSRCSRQCRFRADEFRPPLAPKAVETRFATTRRRCCREAASQRPFKQLADFVVGEFEIGSDRDLALAAAGRAGLTFFEHGYELHQGLAVARDHDLLPGQRPLDELRE